MSLTVKEAKARNLKLTDSIKDLIFAFGKENPEIRLQDIYIVPVYSEDKSSGKLSLQEVKLNVNAVI